MRRLLVMLGCAVRTCRGSAVYCASEMQEQRKMTTRDAQKVDEKAQRAKSLHGSAWMSAGSGP